MSELDCSEVKKRLALGQDSGASAHLERCAACRAEASMVRSLLRWIGREGEIDPPPALDARVRGAILGLPTSRVPFLRPAWAILLAAAWSVGLVASLTFWLSQTPVGEAAPLAAMVLVAGYLVFSSVATLPVLLRRGRFRAVVTVRSEG